LAPRDRDGEHPGLIHIDRHLVHESTSRNTFDGLRARGRRPRSLGLTVGVVDQDRSTLPGRTVDTYPLGAERIRAMQANCREFGIERVLATQALVQKKPRISVSLLALCPAAMAVPVATALLRRRQPS